MTTLREIPWVAFVYGLAVIAGVVVLAGRAVAFVLWLLTDDEWR